MTELTISPRQKQKARYLYQFYDLNNSITKGKHQYFGAIGEVLVHDYFHHYGYSISFCSCYDYDMIVNGSRIEVKTKRTTAPPQGNYNCTVADFNIHQDCDYYIFVRIMDTLEKGWILGMIDKDKFFKKAKFKRQGDPEEGFIFKADCYNLEIQNLIDDTYFKIDY